MVEQKRKPQMIVSDIEAVGAILALEKIFCDVCGHSCPMWPPEELDEHMHAEHADTYWSGMAKQWADYKADPDLARRQNFVTQLRVNFVFLILQRRKDLFEKLREAGVIVEPKAG